MTKAKPEKKNKAPRPTSAARVINADQESVKTIKARAEALAKSTPGQISVLHEIQELAPELIASGQLNAPIFSSDTAISFACGRGDFQAVDFLLSVGASSKAPTRHGQSALMQAVRSLSPILPAVEWEGAQACMELVIAAGCDIHHRDQLGQQAINWASSSPMNIDAARWLLARGANPSAASRDGMTPLHYAARNGSIEMARLFLDAGADAEALADSGGDPRKLDPMGVALIWLGIHQNSDLVTLLSDAKSFAQAQRVAEKERQELGAAASPSSAPRQILAPRI